MNDEDFEQFITLLDAAIASDDPKIQKALKKFVFLIRLNLSDEDCKPGPFTKMMETMDEMQRRLAAIESKNTTYGQPYVGSPGTAVDPFTHWYGGGSSTNGNITFTNATSTTTVPSTTTTTSGNITLSGITSGSTCTGFVGGAYSGMGNNTFSYDMAYENDPGTAIKEDIKDKLTELVKAA
jgi:hypothetical protein